MPPTRAHPLAVSRTATIASRAIDFIWRKGIDDKPQLEPDYLWRIGSRGFTADDERGGRSDDDVIDFRERLERLCRALREEADLNPLGHTLAYGQLTAAIRTRHALGRLWRSKPRLLSTSIAPPIVVVGQMRSGTTRLHRLFAADPRHAGTRFCDSFDPMPRSPDLRPFKAAAALAIARRINPWLDTLHPFGVTRPDEEIGWLSAALNPCAFEAQWHIPSYAQWSEGRDPGSVYREFARILRTDAASRDNATRPRILKCPQFAEDLPALLSVLPTARVVRAERDRGAVLASTVSLVAGQSAFQSDNLSTSVISREWKRKISLREQRLDDSFAALIEPSARIPFATIEGDWRSAMQAVYADLGIELIESAMRGMEREQLRSALSQHRLHSKALAEFDDQRTGRRED